MKRLRRLPKIKFGVLLVAAFAFVGLAVMSRSSAASSGLYLSGASSVQKGNNVTLSLYLNHGTADGVEATLTYDQSKLQYVSIGASGSAFPVELAQSGGNGTVQISRGVLGSVSGNVLVANVTFKALAGGTSATVNVSGNATSSGSYTNPATSGKAVSLTNPVSSQPSDPGPSTPPSSGGTGDSGSSGGSSGGSNDSDNTGGGSGSGGSNQPGGSEKKDNGFGLRVEKKRIELTRARLRVLLSKRARVYIQFGTEQDKLRLSTQPTKFGNEHDVALQERFLIPGTTYYYKVIAEDEQGKSSETEVQSFKTRGFVVRILVRDRNERPITRQKVKFFSEPMEGTTDENGYVTFKDVSPGNHHIEYVQAKQTYSAEVVINETPIHNAEDGTQTVADQTAAVAIPGLDFAASRQTPVIVPAAIAAGLLLVTGIAFVVVRRRNRLVPLASGVHVSQPNSTPAAHDGELIQRVQGPNRPDPGSIVSPHKDDKNQ